MFQETLDQYSWWAVDLGVTETVKEVEITNRGDCCGKNLILIHEHFFFG